MRLGRRDRSLGAVTAAVLAGAALGSAAAGAGADTPAPDPASAQLQGSFLLSGRVFSAHGVAGERAGQTFSRTWTFQPGCSTGGCATIGLIRQRAGGTDRLVLTRQAPGLYTANAAYYYAPLRCGRRTYPIGQRIVFRIAVMITRAAVIGGADMATGIVAAYASVVRVNRTRCVGIPGYDAATYQGQPLSVPGQT